MTRQGIQEHAISSTKVSNSVIRWIGYRFPIFTFLHHELGTPTLNSASAE
jgi:hypothetical protein